MNSWHRHCMRLMELYEPDPSDRLSTTTAPCSAATSPCASSGMCNTTSRLDFCILMLYKKQSRCSIFCILMLKFL